MSLDKISEWQIAVFDLKALQTIKKLADTGYLGPKTSFSKLHIIKALLTIGIEKVVSRDRLAQCLGIGPGAVKTLIKRFKEVNLVSVRRTGCFLTDKGQKLFGEIRKQIPIIDIITATIVPWGVLMRRNCAAMNTRMTIMDVKRSAHFPTLRSLSRNADGFFSRFFN